MGYRVVFAGLLAAVVSVVGCKDGDRGVEIDDRDTLAQAELDALVEAGLAAELPPPLPRPEREIYELKLHRVQVADRMSGEVEASVALLIVAASLFAVDGVADLLLAAFPVGRIGESRRIAKKAIETRKKNERARALTKAMQDFYQHLPPEAEEFVAVASKMTRRQRRALKKLAKMESPNTLHMLMRRELEGDADVAWIASRLGRKHIDRDFVVRFWRASSQSTRRRRRGRDSRRS